MHMADALISPAVGAVGWAVTGGLLVHAARTVRRREDDRRVPLMGTLGAFVFAAQMVNFPIPGTGSSGHLGGGLLLALLLGPHAAAIVMASVLALQALLFADGGLLAFGCNVINLAVLPCFVGYPIVRALVGSQRLTEPSGRRLTVATLAGALVAVELGALSVALQTTASRISSLPLGSFALVLLTIHLPIAFVEGIATAAVVSFVRRMRPESLFDPTRLDPDGASRARRLALGIGAAAAFTAVALSAVASGAPDGLEWSIGRITGSSELGSPTGTVHAALGEVQRKTALLPDYALRQPEATLATTTDPDAGAAEPGGESASAPFAQTSASGLVGSGLTLGIVALVGLALRARPRRRRSSEPAS